MGPVKKLLEHVESSNGLTQDQMQAFASSLQSQIDFRREGRLDKVKFNKQNKLKRQDSNAILDAMQELFSLEDAFAGMTANDFVKLKGLYQNVLQDKFLEKYNLMIRTDKDLRELQSTINVGRVHNHLDAEYLEDEGFTEGSRQLGRLRGEVEKKQNRSSAEQRSINKGKKRTARRATRDRQSNMFDGEARRLNREHDGRLNRVDNYINRINDADMINTFQLLIEDGIKPSDLEGDDFLIMNEKYEYDHERGRESRKRLTPKERNAFNALYRDFYEIVGNQQLIIEGKLDPITYDTQNPELRFLNTEMRKRQAGLTTFQMDAAETLFDTVGNINIGSGGIAGRTFFGSIMGDLNYDGILKASHEGLTDDEWKRIDKSKKFGSQIQHEFYASFMTMKGHLLANSLSTIDTVDDDAESKIVENITNFLLMETKSGGRLAESGGLMAYDLKNFQNNKPCTFQALLRLFDTHDNHVMFIVLQQLLIEQGNSAEYVFIFGESAAQAQLIKAHREANNYLSDAGQDWFEAFDTDVKEAMQTKLNECFIQSAEQIEQAIEDGCFEEEQILVMKNKVSDLRTASNSPQGQLAKRMRVDMTGVLASLVSGQEGGIASANITHEALNAKLSEDTNGWIDQIGVSVFGGGSKSVGGIQPVAGLFLHAGGRKELYGQAAVDNQAPDHAIFYDLGAGGGYNGSVLGAGLYVASGIEFQTNFKKIITSLQSKGATYGGVAFNFSAPVLAGGVTLTTHTDKPKGYAQQRVAINSVLQGEDGLISVSPLSKKSLIKHFGDKFPNSSKSLKEAAAKNLMHLGMLGKFADVWDTISKQDKEILIRDYVESFAMSTYNENIESMSNLQLTGGAVGLQMIGTFIFPTVGLQFTKYLDSNYTEDLESLRRMNEDVENGYGKILIPGAVTQSIADKMLVDDGPLLGRDTKGRPAYHVQEVNDQGNAIVCLDKSILPKMKLYITPEMEKYVHYDGGQFLFDARIAQGLTNKIRQHTDERSFVIGANAQNYQTFDNEGNPILNSEGKVEGRALLVNDLTEEEMMNKYSGNPDAYSDENIGSIGEPTITTSVDTVQYLSDITQEINDQGLESVITSDSVRLQPNGTLTFGRSPNIIINNPNPPLVIPTVLNPGDGLIVTKKLDNSYDISIQPIGSNSFAFDLTIEQQPEYTTSEQQIETICPSQEGVSERLENHLDTPESSTQLLSMRKNAKTEYYEAIQLQDRDAAKKLAETYLPGVVQNSSLEADLMRIYGALSRVHMTRHKNLDTAQIKTEAQELMKALNVPQNVQNDINALIENPKLFSVQSNTSYYKWFKNYGGSSFSGWGDGSYSFVKGSKGLGTPVSKLFWMITPVDVVATIRTNSYSSRLENELVYKSDTPAFIDLMLLRQQSIDQSKGSRQISAPGEGNNKGSIGMIAGYDRGMIGEKFVSHSESIQASSILIDGEYLNKHMEYFLSNLFEKSPMHLKALTESVTSLSQALIDGGYDGINVDEVMKSPQSLIALLINKTIGGIPVPGLKKVDANLFFELYPHCVNEMLRLDEICFHILKKEKVITTQKPELVPIGIPEKTTTIPAPVKKGPCEGMSVNIVTNDSVANRTSTQINVGVLGDNLKKQEKIVTSTTRPLSEEELNELGGLYTEEELAQMNNPELFQSDNETLVVIDGEQYIANYNPNIEKRQYTVDGQSFTIDAAGRGVPTSILRQAYGREVVLQDGQYGFINGDGNFVGLGSGEVVVTNTIDGSGPSSDQVTRVQLGTVQSQRILTNGGK